MISVAKNENALKKRITRFFETPKNIEVRQLIIELSTLGEVIAFGGVIRDLALYGAKSFNSDIDLVVDCSAEKLDTYTTSAKKRFSRNKFGGYRIETRNWIIDLWPLKKTWAFENANIRPITREGLLLTTITNWDAVAYSFKDKKILCNENYIETLNKGELDIVLASNPNDSSVLLRTLRAIFDNRTKKIMPKALLYLKTELIERSDIEIIDLQKKMFRKEFFSQEDIKKLRDDIVNSRLDLFGSKISTKGTTKTLI